MGFLTSITHDKLKKNFFVFFILSSTLPLLLMVYGGGPKILDNVLSSKSA